MLVENSKFYTQFFNQRPL